MISMGNINNALDTLASQVPQFLRLLTGMAYVGGVGTMIAAVIELRSLGEAKNQMTDKNAMVKPVLLFVTGLCLLYTPSFFSAVTYSMWDSATLQVLAYSNSQSASAVMLQDIYALCRVFGIGGFLKGVNTLKHANEQSQAQSSNLTKAFCYMFGGAAIYNIHAFMGTVFNTFGWSIGQ